MKLTAIYNLTFLPLTVTTLTTKRRNIDKIMGCYPQEAYWICWIRLHQSVQAVCGRRVRAADIRIISSWIICYCIKSAHRFGL